MGTPKTQTNLLIPSPLPLAQIRPLLISPPISATLHIAAGRRIFVKQASDHISLLLTLLWQLTTLGIKSKLWTLLPASFPTSLATQQSHWTSPSYSQRTCSLVLEASTCSLLCLDHHPASCPSLQQRATPDFPGLSSDVPSRWLLLVEEACPMAPQSRAKQWWLPSVGCKLLSRGLSSLGYRFGCILTSMGQVPPGSSPSFKNQVFSSELTRTEDEYRKEIILKHKILILDDNLI